MNMMQDDLHLPNIQVRDIMPCSANGPYHSITPQHTECKPAANRMGHSRLQEW
jgi:hypothetical protein